MSNQGNILSNHQLSTMSDAFILSHHNHNADFNLDIQFTIPPTAILTYFNIHQNTIIKLSAKAFNAGFELIKLIIKAFTCHRKFINQVFTATIIVLKS
jgi:hypothetical protein